MKQVLIGVDSLRAGALAGATQAVVRRTKAGWDMTAHIPATALGFPDGLSTESRLLMDVLLVDRDSNADDMSYHRALGTTKSMTDANLLGHVLLASD